MVLDPHQANSDLSKVKTKCYPSTSKVPARCKRSLEEDCMETTTPATGNLVLTLNSYEHTKTHYEI